MPRMERIGFMAKHRGSKAAGRTASTASRKSCTCSATGPIAAHETSLPLGSSRCTRAHRLAVASLPPGHRLCHRSAGRMARHPADSCRRGIRRRARLRRPPRRAGILDQPERRTGRPADRFGPGRQALRHHTRSGRRASCRESRRADRGRRRGSLAGLGARAAPRLRRSLRRTQRRSRPCRRQRSLPIARRRGRRPLRLARTTARNRGPR